MSERKLTGEQWLSTSDVSDTYQVPEETVRYWRHRGYGPKPIKLGRHVRYAAADWDRFIAELRAQSGTPAA